MFIIRMNRIQSEITVKYSANLNQKLFSSRSDLCWGVGFFQSKLKISSRKGKIMWIVIIKTNG